MADVVIGQPPCDSPHDIGSLIILCDLPEGHEGWHQGSVATSHTVNTSTAIHRTEARETISWEPFSAARKRLAREFKPKGDSE